MEVIDLGAAPNSQAETSMELKEQQAIRMSPRGPQAVTFAPERFPKSSELENQQRSWEATRFEEWNKLSQRLQRDPSVLLYYSFEEKSPDAFELTNSAQDRKLATSGVIIGCEWTEGRWPNKQALLYRKPTDRVLFQVAGLHPQVTFVVWARVDALTQPLTSLLMTEEPLRRVALNPVMKLARDDIAAKRVASQVRSVRWELFEPTPRLSLAVGYAQANRNKCSYTSFHAANDFPGQLNWGKWCCLAVTCDTVSGRVIQYHNGQRISDGQLSRTDPLILDFMTLGNLSVSDDEVKNSAGRARRRFYGAFDELIIADRVFGDEEIDEIWRVGQP
jgi:hypothetical protein